MLGAGLKSEGCKFVRHPDSYRAPCVQDTTVIQMFPYGWQLPDGSIMREAFYSGMAEAANATYYRWMNPYPQHAYLRRFVKPSRLATLEVSSALCFFEPHRRRWSRGIPRRGTRSAQHDAERRAGSISPMSATRAHGGSIRRSTMACRDRWTGDRTCTGPTRHILCSAVTAVANVKLAFQSSRTQMRAASRRQTAWRLAPGRG